MTGRRWTKEELEYLQEHWGTSPTPKLAAKLNRTVNAIKLRASRMGLGPTLDSGTYITLNQIQETFNAASRRGYGAVMEGWVKKRGMPIHYKRVNKNRFRVVYLDEFWEWAYENRSYLDFSKMEPLALGKEPDWVKEQRKKDSNHFRGQRKEPWTAEEDSRLIMLVKQMKYTYKELSDILCRSEGAIARRCISLGIKERPLRENPHGVWKEQDYQTLANGIREGNSYAQIGKAIGKSEKAIRGRVYTTYLTENADKVRKLMGEGAWGDGAPVPFVRQAVYISSVCSSTKADLARLCAVLHHHAVIEKIAYEQFFQRAMCLNWDSVHTACSLGCEDCDSCLNFERNTKKED